MDVYPDILIPDVDSPPGAPVVLPDVPSSIQPKPEFPPVIRQGENVLACFPTSLQISYHLELLSYDGKLSDDSYVGIRYGEEQIWRYGSASVSVLNQGNGYPGWMYATIPPPHPLEMAGLIQMSAVTWARVTTATLSLGVVPYGDPLVIDWAQGDHPIRGACHAKFINAFAYNPQEFPTAIERKVIIEEWAFFYRRIDSFENVEEIMIIPVVAAILSQFALLAASSCLTVPPGRRRRHT